MLSPATALGIKPFAAKIRCQCRQNTSYKRTTKFFKFRLRQFKIKRFAAFAVVTKDTTVEF